MRICNKVNHNPIILQQSSKSVSLWSAPLWTRVSFVSTSVWTFSSQHFAEPKAIGSCNEKCMERFQAPLAYWSVRNTIEKWSCIAIATDAPFKVFLNLFIMASPPRHEATTFDLSSIKSLLRMLIVWPQFTRCFSLHPVRIHRWIYSKQLKDLAGSSTNSRILQSLGYV